MAKLLTIIVPVYNTEKYLANCLNSIIVPDYMEQLEVLIIIDGSSDRSIEIANQFANKYPQTFVIIDKENGGHGSVINYGLQIAEGKYLRILDSDDWFDFDNFQFFLNRLSKASEDIVLTHVVCEYPSIKKSVRCTDEYAHILYNKCYTDMSVLDTLSPKFFSMARCTYRTCLLKEYKLQLLEKQSFEDTFLHIFPLLYIKSFIFYDIAIYHYLLERIGQSVKQTITIKQIDDWKRIIKQMVNFYLENREKFDSVKERFVMRALKLYADNEYYLMNNLPYYAAKSELKAYHVYLKSLPVYRELLGKNGYFYILMPYCCFRMLRLIYVKTKQLLK